MNNQRCVTVSPLGAAWSFDKLEVVFPVCSGRYQTGACGAALRTLRQNVLQTDQVRRTPQEMFEQG